jgi:phosphonate transport system permease protein
MQALTFAVIAIAFGVLTHVWNVYDSYATAQGKPAPARIAIAFISIGMLIVGAHITDFDIAKAAREVRDLEKLQPILWPWQSDAFLIRDVEDYAGVAYWYSPCDEEVSGDVTSDQAPEAYPQPEDGGEGTLIISPLCGVGSGLRSTSGTRTPGTTVRLVGSNFIPGDPAEIVIRPGGGREFRVVEEGNRVTVIPDENGDFEREFVMPNLTIPEVATQITRVRITVRQRHEVGSPLLAPEFKLAFEGILETLFLALMATAAGVVLAVPFSFLAARNLMSTNPVSMGIYYVIRLILNIVRSIEPLVWALIAIIWVGPGPFAGVIALTVHTIAALGKLYSESIESIDEGPIEALQAVGSNRLQTIMYAVVPQVIPPFVSFTIYRWDVNVRMSTIIGAVGGGGIGVILIQWIRLADYNAVGIAVWMIAIVVTILDYASARIREAYV